MEVVHPIAHACGVEREEEVARCAQ
jgi:hypothetical protein